MTSECEPYFEWRKAANRATIMLINILSSSREQLTQKRAKIPKLSRSDYRKKTLVGKGLSTITKKKTYSFVDDDDDVESGVCFSLLLMNLVGNY